MKSKHLLLLTSLATLTFALPLQAIEQRTFKSADKTKSFEATLTDYDAKKKTVTVVFASGVKKRFPMNVLSTKDQDYVKANQDLLVISKSVRLKFNEVKVKGGGDGVATGYAIEVYNSGKRAIEDVTLKYTLYYSQGDLAKGGTVSKTKTGTVTTGKMYDADTITVETAKVDIVRKMKPASGGG
ncbi:MAG: hypothetical protein QNL01_12455 [Akkermansiaceae bacterium]|jgi:hypothetical protein|tara:strand:- start:24960 stop:25511 length:552 start_codon:yes stop_codon:yes gene_type:complete